MVCRVASAYSEQRVAESIVGYNPVWKYNSSHFIAVRESPSATEGSVSPRRHTHTHIIHSPQLYPPPRTLPLLAACSVHQLTPDTAFDQGTTATAAIGSHFAGKCRKALTISTWHPFIETAAISRRVRRTHTYSSTGTHRSVAHLVFAS